MVKISVQWHAGALDLADTTTAMNLIEPIHQHAARRPDQPAIFTNEGPVSWSRLDRMIWSTASLIDQHGLQAGERVGVTMADPVLHLLTTLALARMGVAHIAIHVSNSQTVTESLADQLGLKSVISDIAEVAATARGGILIRRIPDETVDADEKARLSSTDQDLPWLILQSSGTTGAPKLAELTHAVAIERYRRFLPLFGTHAGDVFWAASPPDFVVAKQRLTYNLVAGAALCMPTRNGISHELLDFLKRHAVTLACGTPSHLHQLIALAETIPSLRAFEARSAFIDEKLRRAFKITVNRNLFVVYGTNEGEALALASPMLQAAVPNTVGLPTESITIEVVDENGTPQPSFKTGEVRARGPGVVSHYLDNPEASLKSFRDGWFYPGDLGFLNDQGALILQGRKDDMMIFDGMNIYPAEIENVLTSHPAVKEAAAFPIRHPRFQDVPVAAVTLASAATEGQLIQHCKTLLGIKHPKRVLLLEEFPRNSMGKVLKRELAMLIRPGPIQVTRG